MPRKPLPPDEITEQSPSHEGFSLDAHGHMTDESFHSDILNGNETLEMKVADDAAWPALAQSLLAGGMSRSSIESLYGRKIPNL